MYYAKVYETNGETDGIVTIFDNSDIKDYKLYSLVLIGTKTFSVYINGDMNNELQFLGDINHTITPREANINRLDIASEYANTIQIKYRDNINND